MIKTLVKSVVQSESGASHVVTLVRFVTKSGITQYRVMLGKTLVAAFTDLKSARGAYDRAVKIAERE